jgi:hypothetical protein
MVKPSFSAILVSGLRSAESSRSHPRSIGYGVAVKARHADRAAVVVSIGKGKMQQ